METKDIKVWVVEDDERYQHTLAYVLNHTSGLRCAAVFSNFEEVLALFKRTAWASPDVILLDIHMPGMSGIEGLGHLKGRLPEVPIVMLTISDDADLVFKALRAGASGYLLKSEPIDQIISAIREARQGGMLMPAPVARKVLGFFAQSLPDTSYGLTPRETEVLHWIAEGYTQKEAADHLFVSPYTIETHLKHIYDKLHVHSSVEAVAKAIRERLI